MRILLLKVRSSPLLKNLAILVSGSAIAQLIGVIAAPLLSRLYSPEVFGVLGSVLAIVAVLSVAATLQYEKALILENDEAQASALNRLCWKLLYVACVVIAVCLLILMFSGSTDIDFKYIWWIVPITFFTAALNLYFRLCDRKRDYKTASAGSVVRVFTMVSAQVVFGVLGASVLGLIGGCLAGLIAACLVIKLKGFAKKEPESNVSLSHVAAKYKSFPLYSVPQRLLNSASSQMPVFVLGYYFGVEVVGAYWFAMRLLQMPVNIISQALSRVFYRDAADLKDNPNELRKIYEKFTLSSALLMIPVAVPILLWGEQIYVIIFGEEWGYAGKLSSAAVIWVAFLFINSSAMTLFTVYQKLKLNLVYDVALFVVRAAVLVTCSRYEDPIHMMLMFSLVSVGFDVLVIFCWWRYIKKL